MEVWGDKEAMDVVTIKIMQSKLEGGWDGTTGFDWIEQNKDTISQCMPSLTGWHFLTWEEKLYWIFGWGQRTI